MLVFVYGSLRRKMRHHDEMRGATFVDTGRLSDAFLVLYEESYPALTDGTGRVEGEVYQVGEQQLAQLDEFEECPHLYQREQRKLEDGRLVWTYVVTPEVASAYRRIDSWPERVGPQKCGVKGKTLG